MTQGSGRGSSSARSSGGSAQGNRHRSTGHRRPSTSKNGKPLCLIGDSGTGKSHLLIALATEAAMAGYRVR
jgi:DNA replication protein DnaC